jgi:hypothetical protein
MAIRSVTINLVNNTPFYLVHYWEAVCHGSWGPVNGSPPPGPAAQNASLPSVIPPNSQTSWSSADAELSVFTGTEAWVKYSVLCVPPLAGANLLYIYWNNPYAWSSSTQSDYIDYCVAPSEGNFNNPYANLPNGAPCQQQSGTWPAGSTGSTTPGGLTGNFGVPAGLQISEVYVAGPAGVAGALAPVACQLAPVSMSGSGPGSLGTLLPGQWDWSWNIIGAAVVDLTAGETDVNLVYTFVLRQPGSVAQSVDQIYDAKKGLRALAAQNKKPSLRQLFAF